MSMVKALANLCTLLREHGGGDTGKGRVEHRSFKRLLFTQHLGIGQIQAWIEQFWSYPNCFFRMLGCSRLDEQVRAQLGFEHYR